MNGKQLRVFDIGTPWGMFDVMSSYFTRQKEIEVINSIIADLEAGKKIRGINCADCLHTMHIKQSSDGTIRCKNCGIIIKILKYKGRWA